MPNLALMAGNSQASTFVFSSWVFLRLLGLIYLAAFASLSVQIRGLAGTRGILPAAEFLKSQQPFNWRRLLQLPTLCWICSSDSFLLLLSWAGAAVSLMLACDVAAEVALITLWVLYLSLFSVCRLFLSYQWDVLLLETGFLAMFLRPSGILPRFPPATGPSQLVICLFWWLLFRLMFSSGVVKIRSGDYSWRKLTALCHHYETQPLPTPLAWFAHQLPTFFHKVSAVFVLGIELGVPFLIFVSAPLRHIAAALFVILMLFIEATGNYCFFNLLGIALSFLLVDDRVFGSILNWFHPTQRLQLPLVFSPSELEPLTVAAALFLLILSFDHVLRLFRFEFSWPMPFRALFNRLSPFHLVSSYGLFAVMTTERPEIIVEGSADGVIWLAYEFRWKPGDPKRPPRFIATHQPRLDWQMWFVALGNYQNNPWFIRFLQRLLEGSPSVLTLLKCNPFPDLPPRYIRSVIFDYRFADLTGLRETGRWWERERRGIYSPTLELDNMIEFRKISQHSEPQ